MMGVMTGASTVGQGRWRLGSFLEPPLWQGPVLLLSTAVLTASAWLAGVLLPYFVNDLDSLPMSEVTSGAHDPKELWPVTEGPVGALVHLAGVLAGMGGSIVVGMVAAWTAWSLAGRWSLISVRLRLVYLAAFTVSVTILVLLVTPFAQDLLVWSLD
jgi:hypothetical protein